MTARALAWAGERLGSPVTAAVPLLGGQTSTMLSLTTADGARAVLRLVTEEPWRTHGAELTARESRTQGQLAGTAVPAPRSLGLDADGAAMGTAAHLMSLLPGAVDLDRTSDADLGALAGLLVAVHAVRADPTPRAYQSWAWEAKHVVPPWSSDPALWEAGFAVLREPVPDDDTTFLHRDFSLRNVLWDGAAPSGLVDWVETSTGPAWLDVAHCCTNLALDHGEDAAERFAAAYRERTGVEAQPALDVMDVVGFLPPPGGRAWVTEPERQARLEQRLRTALARLGA